MGPIHTVSSSVTLGESAPDGTPRFVGTVLVGGYEVMVAQSLVDPGALNIEIAQVDETPALERLSVHLNDGVLHDTRQID